jgi:hypothetical protein
MALMPDLMMETKMPVIMVLSVIGAFMGLIMTANAEDITNKMPRVVNGKMENTLPAPSTGNSLPSGSVHITPNTTINPGTGASQRAFPRGTGAGVNVRVTH